MKYNIFKFITLISLFSLGGCTGCLRLLDGLSLSDRPKIGIVSAPKIVIKSGIPPFPLPYPKPSTTHLFPKKVFEGCESVSQIIGKLIVALSKSGYGTYSYYYIPNGIAIVTQLEHINKDGSSKRDSERWITGDYRRSIFSLSDYIKALFFAAPGYYRSIIFVVSDEILRPGTDPPTRESMNKLLSEGALKIPKEILEKKINDEYDLIALIYEFKKLENSSEADIVIPSLNQGKTHMVKANIWKNLNL